MDGRITASIAELKATAAATQTRIDSLVSTVTNGLAKLSSADDSASASVVSVTARLASLEKELSELKTLTSQLAASVNSAKTADPELASIKAQQALILEKLNAPWSFDYETLLEQSKTLILNYSTILNKFLQRWYQSILTNYPTMWAQALELFNSSSEIAQVQFANGQVIFDQVHFQLLEKLAANGVPQEYVRYVALGIFGVAGLIIFWCIITVLKAILGCLCCCCCRSKPAKKDKKKTQ